MTGPHLSRVPSNLGPLVSQSRTRRGCPPRLSQGTSGSSAWPEATSGNWSGCSVEKAALQRDGRQQKAEEQGPAGASESALEGTPSHGGPGRPGGKEAEGRFWGSRSRKMGYPEPSRT